MGVHPGNHGVRLVGNHVGERREPVPLEGLVNNLALPVPQLVLAGQQAITEEPPGLRQADALVVIAGVVGQHMLGVLRVVEVVQGLRPDPEANHITVFGRGIGQQAETIPAQLREQARRGTARRSGIGQRPGGTGAPGRGLGRQRLRRSHAISSRSVMGHGVAPVADGGTRRRRTARRPWRTRSRWRAQNRGKCCDHRRRKRP